MRFLLTALCVTAASIGAAQPSAPEPIHQLEADSEADPNNLNFRRGLLQRYTYDVAIPPARRVEGRRKHILWIIRNQPDSDLLDELTGALDFTSGPLADPEGYKEAVEAWRVVLSKRDADSRALMRAAVFFQCMDRAQAYAIVQRGLNAYPTEQYFLRVRGILAALSVAGVRGRADLGRYDLNPKLARSIEAKRARDELLASKEPQTLNGCMSVLPALHRAALFARPSAHPQLASDLLALAEKVAATMTRVPGVWSSFGNSGLSMMYTAAASRARDPKAKSGLLEKAAEKSTTDPRPLYVIRESAEARSAVAQAEKASDLARPWLTTAGSMPRDWNHGDAIQLGNLLLGQAALAGGNVGEAKRRLLAAASPPASAQSNSFALRESFWKGYDDGFTEWWESAVRAGRVVRMGDPAPRTAQRAALIGAAAPKFRLRDLAGAEHSLDSLKGQAVLLNFWTTWCGHCRAEMPTFEKLHREWKDRGVVFLAVDVDEPKETVEQFVRANNYTFPVLITQGTSVPSDYGVAAYPTLVAVDRNGRVADVVVGRRPEPELKRIAANADTALMRAPSIATPPGPE